MKQVFLVLAMSGLFSLLYGQGTVKISNGTAVKTSAGVYLVLDNMHLSNNSSLQQGGTGALKFTGNNNVTISGNSLTIDSLLLSKSGSTTLDLQTNLTVLHKLSFAGGLLDLGNNNIDLETTGRLAGESEDSRSVTTGSGYIQSTGSISNSLPVNLGNLGAVISEGEDLGTTVIKRGHAVQELSPGAYSIKRYYDITPSKSRPVSATLQFHYFHAELNGFQEEGLSLWRYLGNSWSNLGLKTLDLAANYLEKQNIQSFGRLTLASVSCSVMATIPDVYAVTPGGAVNTLYNGYGPGSLNLSAIVNGGTAPYSYKWTQGSPGGTVLSTSATVAVSPVATTTYYLNVSDASGCSAPLVSKTINVVNVRCGARMNQVLVCVPQKGGYSTLCVASTKVKNYLATGGLLGSCETLGTPVTQSNAKEVNQLMVTVIPNPTNSFFSISTKSKSVEPLNIIVTDLSGRLVEVRAGVAANATITIGHNYRPGIYPTRIIQGEEQVVIKMVKLPD